MKYKTLKKLCPKLRYIAGAGLALSLIGTVQAKPAERSEAQAVNLQTEKEEKLLIVIDDLKGNLDYENLDARENLLRSAFHNVAERNEWLGGYEIEYNTVVPEKATNYLRFNVVDWQKNRTNFYECRLVASYIDADGQERSLGSFHGMQSGIAVNTAFDVSDSFQTAAEYAFQDAMKKIKKQSRGNRS